MKPVYVISQKFGAVNDHESVKGLLGKKVYSKSGDVVGKIIDIVYVKNTITGIIVRKFFRRLFIDIESVVDNSDKVQFLTIDPVIMLLGKQVFDQDGKIIGKVKEVVRSNKRNDFDSLIVKKNIFRKAVEIKRGEVSTMKKNVILGVSME